MRLTKCLALIVATVLLLSTGVLAMAADDASSPESELARVESELVDVTAERDALLADKASAAARYEKSKATQQMVFDIIADPTAFGAREEVLDLLDTLAVPGSIYGDDVFGSTGWRSGWNNTLYGGVNANIHTWRSWLAEDGSVGGSMWTWSGTARSGGRFDLQGINLDTYDGNGLMSSVTVYYPYEGAEVLRRFREGNDDQN